MIDKIKIRIEVINNLLRFSYGLKSWIWVYSVFCIFQTVLLIMLPYFYKVFVDDVIIGRNIKMILVVILGYLIITLLQVVSSYVQFYTNNTIKNKMTIRMKLKLINNLFHKEFSYYEKMDIGDIKMILDEDIEILKDFFSSQSVLYLTEYFKKICLIAIILFIDWRMTILTFAVVPFTFFLDHVVSASEKKIKKEDRENDKSWLAWLRQVITGWREIRALNLEEYEQKSFAEYSKKNAYYFKKVTDRWTTRVLVIPQIKEVFFKQFVLYFVGGLLILKGYMTIGVLLLFSQYYSMLVESVNKVSEYDAELQSNKVNIDKVINELNSELEDTVGKIKTFSNNNIKFNDVCFKYDNEDKDTVGNLSFNIQSGDRVAIVGESGVGKTTVIKLITGMIRPTRGEVTFSDYNLNDILKDNYHSKIGLILQDNFLFNTTIRENLLYGNRKAKDDEIMTACKKAYIYEYICSLEEGLDTKIGEKGIKLSGGQRQRIVLARLFLRDVDIFIFDEATSALDQNSESIIHEAINEITKEKTIIVVAHRQSSIDLCEKIIRLERPIECV